MPPINLPVIFGSILTGAIVIDYGVKHVRSAFADSPNAGASSSPSSAAGAGVTPGVGSILKALFPAGTNIRLDRHDQGRDVQVDAGSDVLAPGAGYLVANGSDPNGFGISYPIVHFTSGPWQGLDVYFGHTRSLLSAGEHFLAGDSISQTQHGTGPYVGNATGLPGWVEIGLAAGGIPGPMGQPVPQGL